MGLGRTTQDHRHRHRAQRAAHQLHQRRGLLELVDLRHARVRLVTRGSQEEPRRLPAGVQQWNVLQVLVHIARLRRLVRNHAPHPLRLLGMQHLPAHLNLEEDVKETVRRALVGKRRQVQHARRGVFPLLDLALRWDVRVHAYLDRPQRAVTTQLHGHYLRLHLVPPVTVVVPRLALG